MNDIIYLLVKYFNFKLTNVYHTKKPLKNSQIIKMKSNNFSYTNELSKYLNNFDNFHTAKQCVNLFNFPKNFS